MRNTASSGCPAASATGQAVIAAATAFMLVTRPAVSVAMTASPMLASVIFSSSARAAISAVAACRSRRWRRRSSSSAATASSAANAETKPVPTAIR